VDVLREHVQDMQWEQDGVLVHGAGMHLLLPLVSLLQWPVLLVPRHLLTVPAIKQGTAGGCCLGERRPRSVVSACPVGV
jgi:hypothetical protein